MIRKVSPSEYNVVLDIVNEAAAAYRDVIAVDCWKEPYMTKKELMEEVARGVEFYGWYESDGLLGVMGIQPVKDVTLIRHAYVRRSYQRRGVGKSLLRHLIDLTGDQKGDILVGTWRAAWWAIQFYEKNGFQLVSLEAANRRKLRQYWTIRDRQAETSVVLKFKK